MFKQLFQAMNEQLDGIIHALPTAYGAEKHALLGQLKQLRDISDLVIEEWLLFEEKLAELRQQPSLIPAAATSHEALMHEPDDNLSDYPPFTMPYQRGEGYFKLFMFQQAAKEFETVLTSQPEHLHARLYLALCFIQTEEVTEAYRHLQILTQLTEDAKLKAVAYNAIGCIHAILGNKEKACESFQVSHSYDPNFKDPVYNLEACRTNTGVLQLGVAMS